MGFGSFSSGGGTVADPMIMWHSDSSQAQADIGAMKGRMQGFATTVRGAGIQMQMFGRGILNLVGGVVGAFMSFEDAFVGVSRTVDATEEEFDLLKQGLRDMALVIPQSAADLADIMKIAGQMGIRGVDSLLIFTETVARMGDVTDLSTEQAAFGFARITTIMQISVENVDRLASVIVELGNNFATTEPLITDASVRASGAAKTLGLTTAEMLGIVAQATVVMPRAQSAGSSLTRIWTEMAEAAFDGGTSLDRFADLMHLTTEETSELILNNPADAFKLFIKGTGEAIDAGENWVQILKDIGLNQIRTRELVLNLAGNYPELARAISEATLEWDENGALIEESEKRYATLSAALQLFDNLLGDIKITLGEALAPILRFLIDRLTPFVELFRSFAEDNPKLMAVLGGIIAAFGALIFIVGTALIIAAIVPVLGLISGTVVLVVLAFAALIALGAAIIIFWPEITAVMRLFWENIQKFFTKEGFKERMEQLGDAISDFKTILKQKFDEYAPVVIAFLKKWGTWMRNGLKEIGIIIRDKLKDFGVWIRNGLKQFGIIIREWLIQRGKDLGTLIQGWAEKVRDALRDFGMKIKDTLRETFDGLITPVIEAWKEIWATVQFWWPKYVTYVKFQIEIWTKIIRFYIGVWKEIFLFVWPIIWGILKFAYNVIKDIFVTAWDALTMIIGIAWDIIVPLIIFYLELIMITVRFYWDTLKNIFTLAWGIISASIKIVWVVIKNYVLIGIQLVSGIIRVAMALLRGDWGAAWDAIKETVSRVWALILDTVITVAGEVWEAIKLVWDFIKTETETIWTAVSEAVLAGLRAIRDTGKKIFNGFIDVIEIGINNVLGGIARWITALKKLADAFPGKNPFGDDMQAGIDALKKGIIIPRILGEGALVMGPTLAMVGDKGPELVIPLDQLEGLSQGQTFYGPVYQTINAEDADHAFDLMKRIRT